MVKADFGIDKSYLTSGLAIAGKFAMGGLFSVIFLYTAELYPTIVRYCSYYKSVGILICTFRLFTMHLTSELVVFF